MTVTDQSSCVVSTSILISPPLSVLALADEESSPGAADGYIDLLVLNGVPPVTFQWSNGSTTEDISGLTNGQYSVTVSTGNGCSTVLTILLTTVHTLEPEMSISVSPNPVSNQLTIRILPIVTGNLRLSLFDQAGSLKMAGTFSGSVHQMNIQALPAGIYYLWVESKTERWVQKVVVIP